MQASLSTNLNVNASCLIHHVTRHPYSMNQFKNWLAASFCGSNLEQFVPFLSNFSEQGRFRAHIKHEKANDFIENFKSFMV